MTSASEVPIAMAVGFRASASILASSERLSGISASGGQHAVAGRGEP